jgi:A/G-specific adenine glycosylase
MKTHQANNGGWTAGEFVAAVLGWFAKHGRKDLPWQREPTPYRVWVSEIMLQQTQVAVVIPYFARFMARFPDLASLADAEQDEVLRLWAGLGYYARARHLHRAARQVRDRHAGELPATVEELSALPGIGRSTAGAIASLAGGQPRAILDGNVKRLLTRCFAIPGWPGHSAVLARLWDTAETLMAATADYTAEDGRPVAGAYNQALMDLGATICSRSAPTCAPCPLAARCLARATESIARYPEPKPRKMLPRRQRKWLLVVNADGQLLLEQRPGSGLWGGLWTLPEISASEDASDWCLAHLGVLPRRVEKLEQRRHTFSHFELEIFPERLELGRPIDAIAESGLGGWMTPRVAVALAIPAPLKRLLLEVMVTAQQVMQDEI